VAAVSNRVPVPFKTARAAGDYFGDANRAAAARRLPLAGLPSARGRARMDGRTVRPHPSAARDFDLRWTGTCGTCCWVMRGKESVQHLDRHLGNLPVDPACREASTL
jgi:hypothetical protein